MLSAFHPDSPVLSDDVQAPDQIVNLTIDQPDNLAIGATASINVTIDQFAGEAVPLQQHEAVQLALQ